MNAKRTGSVSRKTGETDVYVSVSLDGSGIYEVHTGNGMLDHLLSQLSRHSLLDITVHADGDYHTGWHHIVEDVGIALGRSFKEALGEGRNISRMGHALVPLDEALAQVAIDLSGRGYASVTTGLTGERVEDLPSDLVRHFLETFAVEAKVTLHATILEGVNDHHKAEALFKSLARAIADAVSLDPRLQDTIPSTKGTLQ